MPNLLAPIATARFNKKEPRYPSRYRELMDILPHKRAFDTSVGTEEEKYARASTPDHVPNTPACVANVAGNDVNAGMRKLLPRSRTNVQAHVEAVRNVAFGQ